LRSKVDQGWGPLGEFEEVAFTALAK
jgi:hypothetical protein